MKAPHTILAAALCALTWGCTPQASHESDKETSPLAPADMKSAAGKWVLEVEVIRKIKDIESDLVAFQETSGPRDEAGPDFHALGDNLDIRIKEVFRACTMPDGPAHDALHDFLLGMKNITRKLRQEDFTDKYDILHELEDHFALFSQQFEN